MKGIEMCIGTLQSRTIQQELFQKNIMLLLLSSETVEIIIIKNEVKYTDKIFVDNSY